jgi:DNA-binding IclR family transcriptional regulator
MAEDYRVPSLDRAMAIFELLAAHPDGLGLADIAATLKLPNNAVFRIGGALVQKGYLLRDEQTKRFTLSRKLLAVGLGAVHEQNIVECAFDLLRGMRNELRETAALGTLLLESAQGLVLLSLDHLHNFGWRIRVGFQFDLHCSAPGKAMVAFLPHDEQEQTLEKIRYVRHTPHTLLAAEEYRRELAAVRECGYALDREEYLAGGYCVSAPILNMIGYPVAAVWTAGMLERLPEGGYETLGVRVKDYAAGISARLTQGPA